MDLTGSPFLGPGLAPAGMQLGPQHESLAMSIEAEARYLQMRLISDLESHMGLPGSGGSAKDIQALKSLKA